MSEYVTGQIYGWNGGECPVHPETKVEVWFRRSNSKLGRSRSWLWTHDNDASDIVCFQVITPYVEPKTIWVNEGKGGYLTAHDSEKAAKSYAHSGHTRVAVKYVEVKE